VIRLRGVRVRRGSFLLSVDELESYGITVILGPNGSGKTTLLEWVGGFLRGEGNVVACGRDVTREPPERRRLPYIPSKLPRIPMRTLDWLRMVAEVHGTLDQVGSVIRELGLNGDLKPHSAGEVQLVAISAALLTEPCALLLDEPTAHLDIINKMRIMDSIIKLGYPSLYVTHDVVEAAYMGMSICTMGFGKLMGCVENRHGDEARRILMKYLELLPKQPSPNEGNQR